jgi:hypothetical protein
MTGTSARTQLHPGLSLSIFEWAVCSVRNMQVRDMMRHSPAPAHLPPRSRDRRTSQSCTETSNMPQRSVCTHNQHMHVNSGVPKLWHFRPQIGLYIKLPYTSNRLINLIAFELAAKFSRRGENPVQPRLCNAKNAIFKRLKTEFSLRSRSSPANSNAIRFTSNCLIH